jgi:hypothetical protein
MTSVSKDLTVSRQVNKYVSLDVMPCSLLEFTYFRRTKLSPQTALKMEAVCSAETALKY